MCGRYTLTDPGDLLKELNVEPAEPIQARYNIAPTQNVPVVRAARGDQGRELVDLRWGLIPFWAKDMKIGSRMINARAETVAVKPSFRNALRKKRCAILADGFYEWKKLDGGGKQPHHIHLTEHRPFLFAGLWDCWTKGEDGPVESFTIITTRPNDKVAELHNRMPVILRPEVYDLWLDPTVDDTRRLVPLLEPYAAEEIEFSPVSRMVNRPANDVPQCVEPIRSQGRLFQNVSVRPAAGPQ